MACMASLVASMAFKVSMAFIACRLLMHVLSPAICHRGQRYCCLRGPQAGRPRCAARRAYGPCRRALLAVASCLLRATCYSGLPAAYSLGWGLVSRPPAVCVAACPCTRVLLRARLKGNDCRPAPPAQAALGPLGSWVLGPTRASHQQLASFLCRVLAPSPACRCPARGLPRTAPRHIGPPSPLPPQAPLCRGSTVDGRRLCFAPGPHANAPYY